MLRRSLASSTLRPLTAVARGRRACVVRLSSTTAATSIKLPKFLVTTVKPDNSPGRNKDTGAFEGLYEFDSTSEGSTGEDGEQPVFLLDVTYEGKSVDSDLDKDKGEGKFEGTAVSQAVFIEALAKTGQELVFFIHGYSVQTKSMVESTDTMQKNFNAKARKPDVDQALVVPVDWACAELPWWNLDPTATYYEDQECSEKAGRVIGKFFRSLKSTGLLDQKLNVVAHSMGNRVLRCVGKSAVTDGWDKEALAKGKSLLEAAPKDLQSNKNLFENTFFVSADIPESVFEEPTDGTEGQQEEHALKSGIAALAVLSKRMHVLHAAGWDQALNASFVMNGRNARLGSRGPYAQGEPAKVWEAVSAEVEKTGGNVPTEENDKLYGNVHVKDCSEYNQDADGLIGHSYQCAPKSVKYYLEHM